MNDPRIVPVKTWLRPETYRQLQAHADRRETTVAGLLSSLADASLKPKQQYTRISAPMILAARDRIAAGDSLTAIAAEYGCSRLGLRKALTRKRDRDERREDAD